MDEQNWQNVKEIFLAALDIEIELRPKFLDEVCSQNPGLRAEVESLLATYEEVDEFIEKPAFQANKLFSNSSNQQKKQTRESTKLTKTFHIPASQLQGDLDNIILMALRKEPVRRYHSVADFSDDISKYLNGLPVSARPNTYKYRAEKYFKRHKIGVLAASLIFVSLLGGIIVSVWQARAAARERDQAQREKLKAEQLNLFLQSMLGASNPDIKPSERDLTVKEILDEASKRLEGEDLSNQPEIKADLQRIIGASYYYLGKYELAEQNINSALEAHRQIHGEEHPETLKTMILMAHLWSSRGENQKANNFYEQRISILRAEYKKRTITADVLTAALGDFAIIKRSQSDSKDAEMLLREALGLKSEISSDAKIGVDILEGVLALTLADQGKFDEAIKIVRGKLENLRKEPNSFTQGLAANLTGLGSFLTENGNYPEAIENLQEAETIYRKLQSPTSLPLGDNLRLQAQAFYLKGKYTDAEMKIRETLEIYRNNSNNQYINYPTALTIQGLIFNKTNRASDAEKILREAVEIREKTLPKGHFMTALAKSALGEVLTDRKNFAEAEPFLRESFESLKISQGENNPRTLLAKMRLEKLEQLK